MVETKQENGEDLSGSSQLDETIVSCDNGLPSLASDMSSLDKPKRPWYKRLGVVKDLKKRAPYYVSDFTDATDWKVLASIIFMFFTSIGPAVTFGSFLLDETDQQLGTVEVLLATALSGVIFALFSGQGMVIVGVTGPVSIFTATLFKISESMNVPFIPLYAWTCIWAAFMHWIIALTNACYLIKWVTRFSCEVFGILIAVIYIATAIEDFVNYFNNDTMESALLSFIIAMGVFLLTTALSQFPLTVYFRHIVRSVISDYAAAISIVIFTGFSYIGKLGDVDLARVQVPDDFDTTSGRGWFVDLGALPTWAIFTAIGPGLILTVLFFFDHNVSSLLSQKPDFNLQKPSAYHWDFFVLGITILVCGLLGIPPTNGLIPQAPLHTMSLATIEHYVENGKPKEKYIKVCEQRVSNLLQAVLIGICLAPPLLQVLGWIPRAVLSGLFLFMGFASFNGNQFYERIMLLFTDKEHVHGPPAFIDILSFKVIMKFTAIQAACWAVIYAVTWTPAAMIFPLFIALLVPLRRYGFPRLFSKAELALLDSEGDIDSAGVDDGQEEDGNENEDEEQKKEEVVEHRENMPRSVSAIVTTGIEMNLLNNDDNRSITSEHILPPVAERERLLRENERLLDENDTLRKEMGLPPKERTTNNTDTRARVPDAEYEAMRYQHYQDRRVSYVWKI